MKKFRSRKLSRFLHDEARAAGVLMNAAIAVVVVSSIVSLVAILVVR
jgi:hypothetical protein